MDSKMIVWVFFLHFTYSRYFEKDKTSLLFVYRIRNLEPTTVCKHTYTYTDLKMKM